MLGWVIVSWSCRLGRVRSGRIRSDRVGLIVSVRDRSGRDIGHVRTGHDMFGGDLQETGFPDN